METLIIPILIALGIFIAIFLILREVMLWYFRINTIVKNQKTTNDLLIKIYFQLGGKEENIIPNPLTELKEDSGLNEFKDTDIVIIRNIETFETEKWTFKKWKDRDLYTYGNRWKIVGMAKPDDKISENDKDNK